MQQLEIISHLQNVQREYDDLELSATIREFGLQILQCPIQMSASGFFNISFSLVGNVSSINAWYNEFDYFLLLDDSRNSYIHGHFTTSSNLI